MSSTVDSPHSLRWWDEFLATQEKELGSPTVDKWLRTLSIIRFEKGSLSLLSADPFHTLWFQEHARDKLLAHLQKWGHKRIKITVSHTLQVEKKRRPTRKKENLSPPPSSFQLLFDPLDPLLTRDHFVPLREHEVTCKIIDELIGFDEATGSYISPTLPFGTYNPLYLYGRLGSGKTHLLMSIAHGAEIQGLRPLYVRAETFVDHVVAAIRAGQMSQFRQAYRSVDLLLIDDIDLFSRKGSTQEELFHTFNTLHLDGKQIVLSSHHAPHELEMIEPRLISRFEWGIVLFLPVAEKKERAALLRAKAQALQLSLPSRMIELFLELFPSHPKNLIHAFETFVLRSQLKNISAISALLRHDVEEILKDLIKNERAGRLTVEEIVQRVTEYFGIRQADIDSKSQAREFSLPRQLAMYLCREELALPYTKIGEIFGRDHSTVISGVQTIEAKLSQQDKEVALPYSKIRQRLKERHR